MSFSAKDAAAFLGGKRRVDIVQPIQAAGVLQWIYFLSSVSDQAEIKSASGIAKLLINTVRQEPADSWESVHRVIGDYLAELFSVIPDQTHKLALLNAVSSQTTNLFIAEHFLAKIASDAGLWKEGKSFALSERQTPPRPDQVPPERILEAEGVWLNNVRVAAAAGNLHKHPHLDSILHRWGQFNSNDYSEVPDYFAKFCGDGILS